MHINLESSAKDFSDWKVSLRNHSIQIIKDNSVLHLFIGDTVCLFITEGILSKRINKVVIEKKVTNLESVFQELLSMQKRVKDLIFIRKERENRGLSLLGNNHEKYQTV